MSEARLGQPVSSVLPAADYIQLLRSVDVIIWEGDPATFRLNFVSEQAERITGYPVEAWLEPNFWLEHLHPSDRNWAREFCTKATEAGDPHAFEYRMIAADGQVIWLRDVVSVEMENGRPARFGGVMVDVTERRRAEEARHAAETQLRAIVANAPVVIFAVDNDGVITLCEGRAHPSGPPGGADERLQRALQRQGLRGPHRRLPPEAVLERAARAGASIRAAPAGLTPLRPRRAAVPAALGSIRSSAGLPDGSGAGPIRAFILSLGFWGRNAWSSDLPKPPVASPPPAGTQS